MKRKILKADLKFCTLGLSTIRQTSLYVMLASTCWYFVLFIYLKYQGSISFLRSQQIYRSVIVVCGISFLAKIVFLLECIIGFKLFPPRLSYIVLIASEEFIYFFDLFAAVYMQDSWFKRPQLGAVAIVTLVNLLVALFLKCIGQIIKCNYSLVNPNPFKKLPEFKFYMFRQALKTTWFILLFIDLSPELMVVKPILMSIYVIIQARYDLTTLPHSYDTIGYIELVKLSVLFSMCIAVFMGEAFPIMAGNSELLFTLLFIFLGCSAVAVRKSIQTKYLECSIQQLDDWKETYIKLARFAELLKDTSQSAKTQLSLSFGYHQIACTDPTCLCKSKITHECFRSNNKTVEHTQANLAYFLLIRTEFNRTIYNELICPHLLVMSTLSWMHLYPRLFYEAKVCIETFPKSMHMSNSNLLHFMVAEDLTLIQQNNKKKGSLPVESIQKYEERFHKLAEMINAACKNKINIWNSLANKVSEQSEFARLLEAQLQSRKQILKSYKQVLQISNSEELWKSMMTYARHIVKDRKIQNQIVKHNKKSINFSSFFTVNRNHMSYLIEHDCTCLFKISMQKHSFGHILWHSKNSSKVFEFNQNDSKIGQPVEVLMPSIYKEIHRKKMLQWFEEPSDHKLNNFLSVFISTPSVEFVKAQLYVKVLPGLDSYDLLAMVTKTDNSEFLVIDDFGTTIAIPNFFQQINRDFVPKKNFNVSLFSSEIIDLMDGQEQIGPQMRVSMFIPVNHIEVEYDFLSNVENLRGFHNNKIDNDIIQNLRRYFFSKVQMCKGSQYDMILQPTKIKIETKYYIIFRLLKLEKGFNFQGFQMNRVTTTINYSHMASQKTPSFNSKILYPQRNDIIEGSSYSSSTDANDVSQKKEMINGYSSKHLRSLLICSGICLLFMFVNLVVKELMINKMVQGISQSIGYGPMINMLVQMSSIAYDYAMIHGYRDAIGLSPNQTIYFFSKTQELALNISDILNHANVQEQIYNKDHNINNPLEIFLNTVAQMKTPSKNIDVKMNIFFTRWITDCLNTLESPTGTFLGLPGLMQQNFDEMQTVKKKLDSSLKDLWTKDFNNVQNTIIVCFALNVICAAIIMYYMWKYLMFRIHHKRQILDVFLRIPYSKICMYLDESIYSSNHFDQILWQNDEKRDFTPPPNNIKVSFISSKKVNYWWIFFGIFILMIFPESVGTPQICSSLRNSLSLTNQANGFFQVSSESIGAVIQFTNYNFGNSVNGNPNMTAIQQRFQAANDMFLEMSKSITVSNHDGARSFHDTAVGTLTENICLISTNLNDRLICQSVPFLGTGLLSSFIFVIREFQQIGKALIQTKVLNPNRLSEPIAIQSFLSLYFSTKQLYKLSSQIVKTAQLSVDDIHTVITVVTSITIVIVTVILAAGVTLYRQQNEKYTMRCKYLLIIPDDEFRENLYLDITLNRLKEISFVKYG